MPSDKRDRLNLARAYSLGFNFVAAFCLFAALGYWFDSSWDTSPWGLIVGAALGLIGGMYNLVKTSLAAFERPTDRRADPDGRDSRAVDRDERSD